MFQKSEIWVLLASCNGQLCTKFIHFVPKPQSILHPHFDAIEICKSYMAKT